ncbi:MAG: CocE/NonD family hydrolase [Candidatus Thermoplasmatota archaeon]
MRWFALAASLLLVPLAGCFGASQSTSESPAPSALPTSTPTLEPTPLPAEPVLPHFPNDGASELIELELESFDGHLIPVTVHKPLIANATQPVPMLLHSHGFTGSRTKAQDAFKDYVAAGFGVVSFDERGHGDARGSSEVQFMSPDYEVKDVLRVVDEIATFDWILMESPGDPVLGGIGGSYGGAFQMMGAIFDPRFDAIVPEITWNDIVDALAPNGAIKSGWVDLFYLAGNTIKPITFSNDFHAGWTWATATNTFPAGQAPGVPDLESSLHASSPAAYPERLTIPTLLIQGMPDTLFPLNQAVANLRILEANNVTAALATHLDGHILHTASQAPGQLPYDVGIQGVAGGHPCGTVKQLGIAWHQKHLLGLNVSTGPRVCISLEDETAVTGETFPLETTVVESFDVGGPLAIAQAPAGASLSVDLFTAEADTVVAGIPHLKGMLTAAGADAIVYFSLQVPSRNDPFESIVDDQVFPIRVAGPVTDYAFELDLGGVGVRLKAGETLTLVASTVTPMFFGNAERLPGAVLLDELVLELPIVK